MSYKYLVVIGSDRRKSNPLPVMLKQFKVIPSATKLTRDEVIAEASLRRMLPEKARWVEVYQMVLLEDESLPRRFLDVRRRVGGQR
jgi:hypothetical protein